MKKKPSTDLFRMWRFCVLLFWVTHLKSHMLLECSAVLHRRVAQEVLGEVCTDPEVDCYDLFGAVAGTGVTST